MALASKSKRRAPTTGTKPLQRITPGNRLIKMSFQELKKKIDSYYNIIHRLERGQYIIKVNNTVIFLKSSEVNSLIKSIEQLISEKTSIVSVVALKEKLIEQIALENSLFKKAVKSYKKLINLLKEKHKISNSSMEIFHVKFRMAKQQINNQRKLLEYKVVIISELLIQKKTESPSKKQELSVTELKKMKKETVKAIEELNKILDPIYDNAEEIRISDSL